MPTKIHPRQIVSRALLSKITGLADSELDNILNSINYELILPFNIAQTTPPSLVANIGSIEVTNPETLGKRIIAPILDTIPSFSAGTITFDSTGAGNATPSSGSALALGMSSNEYLKLGIHINSSGQLVLTKGAAGANEAAATAPAIPANVYAIGFIVVQTDGSNNVAVITTPYIHQYTGANRWTGQVDLKSGSDLIFHDDDDSNTITVSVPADVTTNRTPQIPDDTGNFVLTSATQVLTKKDIDGGTASNTSRITVPQDTKTNLDALTRKEGTVVYANDLDTLFVDDGANLLPVGSNSGSGEKNYITNPSAKINISGWTAVGNISLARTNTAAELPRENTTSTGIKIIGSSTTGTSDYVYYDFNLDDVDLNKKLNIKWAQKILATYSAGEFEVFIAAQSNRTVAVATPKITNIPAIDFDFNGSGFDTGSTAALSLVIRATGAVTDGDGIVISDVILGPGIIQNASALGDVYTGVVNLKGSSSDPVKGTVQTDKITFTRVGSWLEFSFEYKQTAAGTNGAGTIRIGLPTGLTIDTTKLTGVSSGVTSVGKCYAYTGVTNGEFDAIIGATGGTNYVSLYYWLDFDSVAALTYSIVSLAGTAPVLTGHGRVPIAEWAGTSNYSGQNNVEYAYNTGTWDAADSTSFGYGPAGGSITGALTAARVKRVRFASPIQATDRIDIEISENGTVWIPALAFRNAAGSNYIANSWSSGAGLSSSSGVYYSYVSGTPTDLDVNFLRYTTIANDDAPVTDWENGWKWRVVKRSAGDAVGFGLAQSTTPGLIPSYETGTWTPSIGGTTTYTTALGKYIKIGKLVIADFDIQINSLGTGSTTTMSGLPYACNATTRGHGAVSFFTSLAASVYALSAATPVGTSTIQFFGQTNFDALQDAVGVFGNSARIRGSVTFITD